jgi:hypothetical protein
MCACDFLDRDGLLDLGLEPTVADALLAESGVTGNDCRKVVEAGRLKELAALGLVLEVDPWGWCVIRRPGHNMAARGGTWEEAFARLFALLAEPAALEPAPRQRELFDALP